MTEKYHIKLSGWNDGIKTIKLMKLIMKMTDMKLKNSKKIVDDILDGIEKTVEFRNKIEARHFMEISKQLGVRFVELVVVARHS